MITNFRHVGIVVSDLDKSMQFYCKWLGFEVQKQAEESGAFISRILGFENTHVTTVKMSGPDGILIELLFFKSPSVRRSPLSLNNIGITHFALTVSDIDHVYKVLSEKGVSFRSSPQISPDGYAKVAFCQDPDGNFLELVEVISS